MGKIQKFSDLQPSIGFTEFDIYTDYRQSFLSSELGRIYSLFPFSALAREFGLKEHSLGRDSYFSPKVKSP